MSSHAPFASRGIGQGDTAGMRTPSNPLLFALQVGKKPSFGGFIKSYWCLAVLPCPKAFCVVVDCFDGLCMLVLLLSGDVELNPGPIDEDMKALLNGQKEILEKIGMVNQKLDDYMARTDLRLNTIETDLKFLAGCSAQLDQCERTVETISVGMVALRAKIDDVENRSRQNNVIIYGLKEDSNETTASLRQHVVTEVFEAKMGVKITTLERIHRLGRRGGNSTRPVILRLFDQNEKTELFRNARKLKDTGLSLCNDHSQDVRIKRKHLWDHAKAEREQGDHSVKLVRDKLYIDGKSYTWDSELQEVVQVKRS